MSPGLSFADSLNVLPVHFAQTVLGNPPDMMKVSDVNNIVLGKLGFVVLGPAPRTVTSEEVSRIIAVCHPFKIFNAVVALVAILVIYSWQTAWVWDEKLSYNAVHSESLPAIIFPEAKLRVAASWVDADLEFPPNASRPSGFGFYRPVGAGAVNTAIIGYFSVFHVPSVRHINVNQGGI